jgi:galactokinase
MDGVGTGAPMNGPRYARPVDDVDGPDTAALARDPERLRAALIARAPAAASDPDAIRVVHAPGRVNLIGDHTDYNEGFALPAAIDLGISIALVPVDDGTVELTIAETRETGRFDLRQPITRRRGWLDYVRGMAWALAASGTAPRGFRGLLASDLPQGAGLSSSAALELASGWALSGGDRPAMSTLELIKVVNRAENGFIGLNNGLMDQYASAYGEAEAALLLDCRSLTHRSIRLPAGIALVACHSGSRRRLESSAYNERRAQCEAAVAIIQDVDPAVRALRDVTPELLEAVRPRLDDTTYARARHVIREDQSVLDAVKALERGDLGEVGRLFYASHASLRDDYAVSSPELDVLVEIARATPGVIGARLTGAGFGGCTINLVHEDAVTGFRSAVLREYPARTGLTPRVLEVHAAAGARRLI